MRKKTEKRYCPGIMGQPCGNELNEVQDYCDSCCLASLAEETFNYGADQDDQEE